jgi:hypothetical protein
MQAWLDRAAARRWFERAARGHGDHPVVHEIERRMAARLEYVKHQRARIVEVGCGAGAGLALLSAP